MAQRLKAQRFYVLPNIFNLCSLAPLVRTRFNVGKTLMARANYAEYHKPSRTSLRFPSHRFAIFCVSTQPNFEKP